MKKQFYSFVLITLVGMALMNACKEPQSFGDADKQAVSDTINQLMTEVNAYAEQANTPAVFQYLSDDSSCVFFSAGMAYSKSEIIIRFGDIYSNMKSQDLEDINHQVLVFSPDAAAWIGIMKGHSIGQDDKIMDMFLLETWIWQRGPSGWKVVHYHESLINMPSEAIQTQVASALTELSQNIAAKVPAPTDVIPVLTEFLQKNPLIYGSTLAFSPGGQGEMSAPYVYKAASGITHIDLAESYDYTDEEWYVGPVKQKAAYWSKPYYDAGGGRTLMTTYSIPIYDGSSNLIGVLTADIELK